jgi:hypothetical protein
MAYKETDTDQLLAVAVELAKLVRTTRSFDDRVAARQLLSRMEKELRERGAL